MGKKSIKEKKELDVGELLNFNKWDPIDLTDGNRSDPSYSKENDQILYKHRFIGKI